MPNNVAASMTASIVIDKSDLLAQILKGLSEGQKELENNKLELYFDFSDSKNKAEFEKVIQRYKKELSSNDFVIKIKNQGIEETIKSLDKLLDVIKSIASGKGFGIGSGNGIGNSTVDEKQLKTVIDLFTKMESHLSSIKKVFSDVGDGGEFSPLLKTLESIENSINNVRKATSKIKLNVGIDLGNNTSEKMNQKISQSTSRQLEAYRNLFSAMKGTGKTTKEMLKFFEPDDASATELIGAYQGIIKRAEEKFKVGNGNAYKKLLGSTYDDLKKEIKNANAQLGRAENKRSENGILGDLFGSQDLSGVIEQLNTIVSKLDEISSSAKGFTETFKNGLNVNASVEEIQKLTNRVKELEDELNKIKTPTTSPSVNESNISSGRKDAFPNADSTASVEKIADGFKEVKQNTEQATEATEKYQRVLSQVGELGVDAKVSAMYQRNDGQLESVSWKAKRDNQGQILYDKNGNIDYDFNSTVISKYEQLEKIITTADNKLRDLQKSLKDTQNLNSNASTKNIEEQIQYQKDYIQLLEQTVKAISQQDEYLLYEQQIIDARAKAEKEYNLNQGTKSDISNAKQLASDEQKRQKSIEQTNRLLNKQQIIIDGIEKSYSKAANNDLDKAVNSQSDLAELANKKAQIQTLLNKLNGQDRNSSNEKEFLQVEKLIAEYKQLAKDKLKANNPSKQELGGQDLDVLLANQVTQYNKLISQSEKYGDATKEITNELKAQRDLIAEQDKNGVYVARSKKADGSEITANDYYDARDNYKINKSIFSSYETNIKSASNMAKQEASNIQAEWDKNIKAIQDYMDAVTKLNNLKAKDKGTGSEANQIALQTQNVEKLKQVAFEARQNLSSMQAENPDIIAWKQWVDMMELFDQASKGSAESAAKLKDVLDNIKTPSLDKYENKLASYQNKTVGYNATIARFNNGGWISKTYLENVQAIRDAVKQYTTLLDNIKTNQNGIASDEDIQDLKEYESEIEKTISTVTNMSAAEKGYNFVSGQKELDKIHKLLNENSKMSSETKAKIKAYYKEIESGNPSMSLDRIHGEIMKIYNAEVEAGRAGRSFFDTLKNSRFHQIAAQMAGMFGFYDVINVIKQAASTVTELNTQITELAKVSEQSSKQIYADFDSYADIAKEVRGTISDTIAATADWSKNGYSIPDAKKLAEVSQLYKNVGDGIDINTANESLISTLKGFKLEADEAEHIVDVFNEVSNNEAISSGGIGEALQRSAASFNAANTSLEQSVALVTATNSVLQDPEKVGNMWKTKFYCLNVQQCA